MVFDDQSHSYDYNYGSAFGSASSLGERDDATGAAVSTLRRDGRTDAARLTFKMPYQRSFDGTNWSQLAEATLPLKTSSLMGPGAAGTYGGLSRDAAGHGLAQVVDLDGPEQPGDLFHASIERRSRQISKKLINVNLVSLITNLALAIVAFYFSYANNSSSTTAFAADCVLDFISSAIVLWRYYGDLSDFYMHAREQIACIYLGALFEISALGIIIKASSDIASGAGMSDTAPGYDLMYLAAAAVIAFSGLIVSKWSLYKTIRDKSILLDVINTVISTVFAVTLCLMTILGNIDASFWYFDPILSIILALFMAGFGLKVIHQNFNILRPDANGASSCLASPLSKIPLVGKKKGPGLGCYETNLNASLDHGRANWQKNDHSTIEFV